MNVRLLIILLVLLVILFASGVGMGVVQGSDSRAGTTPDFVQMLQDTLAGAQPRLGTEDIGLAIPASCTEQFKENRLVLLPGAGCIFFINAAKPPVRTLQLEIAPGQEAEILFDPAGSNRFTAKQSLDSNRRQLKVDAFQEGGELRIRCLSALIGNGCTLAIQ